MNLSNTINNDLKEAMRAKDKIRLAALRAVKSAFLIEKTSKSSSNELSDDVALKIIQKLIKQRKDSAELYKQGNRDELYENEIAEAEILENYLPKQMSRDEVWVVIKKIVEENNAFSMKDMGLIMKIATKKLAGKSNGKTISEIVKKMLS